MDWKDLISERQREIKPSMMGKLLKMAEESKSIISLGPGEPDFDSPDYILKAAKKSLDKKQTHYSPVAGRGDLREAIAKKLKRDNKIKVDPGQVTVGCGSNEMIFNSLMCLIDPGEEVLVPDPGFLAYIPCVQLMNGYPVSIPLSQDEDFEFTPENVKDQIKDKEKVKAIIINTPGNPTGTVLSKKSIESIAEIAVENDLIIISDEAYERFIYDDAKHISIGSLNGMEDYVLTLQTFSKTYAMPGFRIGYAAGPKPLIDAMNQVHTFTTLTAPTVSQVSAVEALNKIEEAEREIEKMRKSYDERRRLILKRLSEIDGFSVNNPKGAFYVLAKADFGMSSVDFTEWLIKNAKVSVVPGTEFGRYGEGFVRFSYATSEKKIEEAMDRIEKAVKKLK